jgi:hypothetical protein
MPRVLEKIGVEATRKAAQLFPKKIGCAIASIQLAVHLKTEVTLEVTAATTTQLRSAHDDPMTVQMYPDPSLPKEQR